ncbi:FtsX-like permease family protein [Saccharothrix australiensis]|uniref:FtsX-like permease family protein n=1 Tax=Saccharothrix australiensis TaxID=2072 RepID=A0A495W933_9PSEU|nr:FtsX-like permease family protein [Saccharothrix australiensis]RKT57959.1 FtsX-like permease family protein [Saccharothrix australiensis]
MKRTLSDLFLGVRLALGGGRTSWTRLALTAAGIGLGVAVLLAASSVPTMLTDREARTAAAQRVPAAAGATGDVLHLRQWATEFRGQVISGSYVLPSGPGAPVPPGVSKLPGDGEIVVSPALADLIDSPGGELLRERFPQRRTGLIAQAGLNAPSDLVFVAGDATIPPDPKRAVGSYGGESRDRKIDPVLSLLIIVGVVALLFPVLVFVGITTRLGGSERDRRLAALRLVGAAAHRVRLIAAGEALLGALAGLAVGAVLFLTGRQFVEGVELMGISVFVSDLTPSLPLAVLIAVLVPVMAVVTSLVAMRRTVIEPLGVVRRSKPVRRVMWWRTVPIFIGTAALVSQAGALGGTEANASVPVVVGGILMLLLSIPVLLPWLVERVVGRLHGGAPSWLLAIRRLQLESGTAARVVGGVAVVLAGGIALQSVLASAESKIVDRPIDQGDRSLLSVSLTETTPELSEQVVGLLDRTSGGDRVHPVRYLSFKIGEDYHSATVASCETLRLRAANLPSCHDGDSFYIINGATSDAYDAKVQPGRQTTLLYRSGEDEQLGPEWTIPDFTRVDIRGTADSYAPGGLLLTPSALRGVDRPLVPTQVLVQVDPNDPDVVENARNAVAPLSWHATSYYEGAVDQTERIKQFTSIRRGLLAGSLVTLLLAGASLLVMALEQVRERRRPLAVLAASGVPRGALGRSLLWQHAVPLLLALVVATAIGSGLAVLLLRIIEQPIVLDWPGIAVLSGASAALVVAVTLLTLPSLWKATGALGLRSE